MTPLAAIRAVYRSGLTPTEKAVAAAWCSHLDTESCSAHAGPSLLVEETGLSMKSCKRVLASLRASRVLEHVGEYRANGAAYQVDRFHADRLPARLDPGSQVPGVTATPGHRVPTPRVTESLPPGSQSPPMEDKKEDKKEANPPQPPQGGADESQVAWILRRWGAEVMRVSPASVREVLRKERPPCTGRTRPIAASLEEARRRLPALQRQINDQRHRTLASYDTWLTQQDGVAALLPEEQLEELWRAEREEAGLDPPADRVSV